jgi:uncharacterized SAM-binding protein YcdF (DUF218 family)
MGRKLAKKREIQLALILAALISCGCWMASTLVLRSAAALWIVSEKIEPADAIVVLGGAPDVRPSAAAILYNSGLADKVLIANTRRWMTDKLEDVSDDTELNREVLLKLGVPPSAIAFFGDDLSSTYDETQALLAWAKSNGAKRLIVPTDLFSSRRLRWILGRKLSAAGVHFSVQANPSPRYTATDWWIHKEGLTVFRNEVIKYLYYRIRY